ncbi:HAMP domain-containing protein [Stappia taiwanensis]|uniref:HAMP domain-containing protein n=1 Tax=Stappia taiwanensis TaxID=992267 RepID=A0A838XR90_9HYPH|nr:methyl-accepting chemotaxis protein [Stappia taiwanensis]MBA4612812.1 HAMP domain-containing protein [Stappia taiwanensis]GGE89904.1 hypothetical protein GCM10007285_16620 [Stappia taiwanensis]
MSRLLGVVGNLGFAAKIGGGFAIVLLLTAVVGGVGIVAIGGLTDQMKTSEIASRVMVKLQDVSASREAFLTSRDETRLEQTNGLIGELDTELKNLRASVADDAGSLKQVDEAIASIVRLQETVTGVGAEIATQTVLLGNLQEASVKLDSLATTINNEMQDEGRAAKQASMNASAVQRKADQIGRIVSSLQEEALRTQYLFLHSTTSTAPEALQEAIKEAADLADNARVLTHTSLEGIDKALITELAAKAANLEENLDKLVNSADFAVIYQVRQTVRTTISEITELADKVRTSAYTAIDAVQAEVRNSAMAQIKVDLVSKNSADLARQALTVKASTLQLLSSLGEASEAQVRAELAQVRAITENLTTLAGGFPAVAILVKDIQTQISAYDTAFGEMLTSVAALERMTAELGTLAVTTRGQIADVVGQQASQAARAGTTMLWTIATTLLIATAFGALVAVVLSLAITRPTRRLTAVMGRLAEGDTDVTIPDAERGDEIGAMSRTVEVFRDNALERARMRAAQEEEQAANSARQARVDGLIAEFRTQVQELLTSVGDTAGGMEATAQDLTRIASESSMRAEETTRNSTSATQNVESVATAAEELAASIAEISRQVGQTTQVVEKATQGTRSTNETVAGLAQAANKIGEVVTLIQAIAEQTNLLALNATIEAARAGEAGRGFAVVAAEVKELATQTSKATEEIGTQIATIQGSTREAVEAIGAITATMQEVDSYTSAIAAAVEQQGAATNEISRNVQNAAEGTTSVSANVGELSNAVAETNASADMVLAASGDVGDKTRELRQRIDGFLTSVAAA